MNVAVAKALATLVHRDINDKAGKPYISHPAYIAREMAFLGYSIYHVQLAWLHDTVEDTKLTLPDVEDFGFDERVVVGLDAISHRKGEPREEYLVRVMAVPLAHDVKWFDVKHNSMPERLSQVDEHDRPRLIRKYQTSARTLRAPNPPEGWFTFGYHADQSPVPSLEFSELTGEDGLPMWEKPC